MVATYKLTSNDSGSANLVLISPSIGAQMGPRSVGDVGSNLSVDAWHG